MADDWQAASARHHLAIAATAAHQAVVTTRNLADFRLIAAYCPWLVGMNPWTGEGF